MFRKKQNQQTEAQDVGMQIALEVQKIIDEYCSEVIYFAASIWLRNFSAEIDKIPSGTAEDREYLNAKADKLVEFSQFAAAELSPYKEQVTDALRDMFDPIMMGKTSEDLGAQGAILLAIDRAFEQQKKPYLFVGFLYRRGFR